MHTIFLVANLVAFILDYLVQLLQKWGIQRSYGVLAIVFMVGLGIILFSITLAPNFVDQLTGLSRRLPSWIESGSSTGKTTLVLGITNRFSYRICLVGQFRTN